MGGWASRVKGIQEGTCCVEHWVFYTISESWDTTSEANDVLYGDSYIIVIKINEKKRVDAKPASVR